MKKQEIRTPDESVLKDILENGRVGYWDWDIPSGSEFMSPSLKKMFGYADNEIANSRDAAEKMMFEEDLTKAMDDFRAHVKSGGKKPFSCEIRNHHKDGSTVWVLSRGKVIEWDKKGNPVRMVGCNIDITEQKRSEESQRNIAANLQAIMESTNDIIASYDLDQRLIAFNKACSDAYRKQFAVEIYPGLHTPDIFPESMRNFWDSVHARALEGETFSFQFDMPDREAGVRSFESICNPIREGGEIVGVTVFSRDITDKKRVERALKESEENYRTLVDNMQDAVYRCDLDGNVVYMSPSAAQLLRYPSAESLIGVNIVETLYYYSEDRGKLLEMMKQNGSVSDYEVTLKRSDNTPILVQTSSHYYCDANGNLAGIEGVYHDVTMRKRAEKELRKSEEAYRSLVNNMQDVVYRCDLDGNVTFTTPSAVPLMGYETVDEMIGLNLARDFYCNPEDRERFLEALRKNGKVYNYEIEIRRKDNSRVIVATNSQYYRDADGAIIGVEGVYHDITERKKAEEALRESEEKYRSLINNMQDAVYRCDLGGKILFNSPAAARILGYDSADDMVGLNFVSDFYARSEDRDKVRDLLEKYGALNDFEIDLRRKDGSIVTIVLSAYYSRDADGNINGFEGIYHDITGRKRAEDALKKNEAFLRSIFEASPAGIALAVDRKFTKVNNALCRITGYAEDELIGNSTRIVYFSDGDFAAVGVAYGELERKGIALTQARLRHRNGEEIYALLCLSPLNRRDLTAGVVTTVLDITDIKTAERTIEKNETMLQSIFDVSPAGIALVVNDKLVKVNNALGRITGYSEEEMIGGDIRFLYYSDDDYQRIEQLHQSLVTSGPVMAEIRFRHKNGSEINALLCLSLLNQGDLSAGVLTTVLDITDIKRAEQTIQKNEALLWRLFDESPVGIALLVERRFIKVNKSYCRITGYNEYDLHNSSPRMMYFCDEEFDHVGTVYGTLAEREFAMVETRHRKKDGTEIFVLIYLSPLYPEDVKAGVVATVLDITDSKRAEQALKSNETRLQSIFDASPAGIALLKDMVLTKVNGAFCRITGYSEDDVIGKSTRVLYYDDDEFNRVGLIYASIEKSGSRITEAVFRTKDGGEANVLICLSPLEPHDVGANVIGTFLDITEIKKMEREKARLEEMLLHSQKLESIGRLAGGIAHDFNNILTAILGNAELVKGQLSPSSKAYFEMEIVETAAMSAANLTRQLLAFSRKQVVEPKILNLNDSVQSMRKMLQTLSGENIILDVITDDDLDDIKADPGHVEQIIINLSVNARDAMPDGGKLVIETRNVFLDEAYSRAHINVISGPYVMLAVSDTGVGMTKDVMDHCFEPFFSTKETGKGTGLGLSTVYGLVNQCGGTIEVYSEPGRGTVFKLYFPAEKGDPRSVTVSDRSPSIQTGNETIMIVEDNKYVRQLSVDILSRAGYNVISAETGEDAIATARAYEGEIRLLITDVILPGMNGKDTSGIISALHPEMRTLYNSGYTAEVIDRQGVLEPGIDFINKPYNSQQLTAKVREILDRTE